MDKKLFRIDGILWEVRYNEAIPYCPTHRLKLESNLRFDTYDADNATALVCEDCGKEYGLPREFWQEKEYVVKKVQSIALKDIKVLNLDDEAIPLAEEKLSSKDNRYFVISKLFETKIGNRLVVYAGEKGKTEKTQIFVEPEIKRLAFDQKDLHPSEVFLKLEATFDDGTKTLIEKKVI